MPTFRGHRTKPFGDNKEPFDSPNNQKQRGDADNANNRRRKEGETLRASRDDDEDKIQGSLVEEAQGISSPTDAPTSRQSSSSLRPITSSQPRPNPPTCYPCGRSRPRNAYTQPCKFFLRGYCRLGNRCTYSHDRRLLQRRSDRPDVKSSNPQNEPSVEGQHGDDRGSQEVAGANHSTQLTQRDPDAEANALSDADTERDEATTTGEAVAYKAEEEAGDFDKPRSDYGGARSDRHGARRRAVCQFYHQGTCRRGSACRFVHEKPRQLTLRERQQPSYSNQRSSGTSSRDCNEIMLSDSISCEFGNGASVLNLILGSKASRTIVISGLGVDTTHSDVEARLSRFGMLHSLSVQRGERDTVSATATFLEAPTAVQAVDALHGTSVDSWSEPHTSAGYYGHQQHLQQRHQQTDHEDGKKPKKSEKVSVSIKKSDPLTSGVSLRVQWYAPSRCLWVHFQRRDDAEAAERKLHGLELEGRTIQAKFQRPSFGQTRSFSVWIGNMAEHVSADRMKRFVKEHTSCQPTWITFGDLPFSGRNGLSIVKRQLQLYGGPLSLFSPAEGNHNALKQNALVKFVKESDAHKAYEYFRKTRSVNDLGGSRLFVQRIFSVKYTVPSGVGPTIVKEMESGLREYDSLRSSVFPSTSACAISVQADTKEEITAFHRLYGPAISGEVLRDKRGRSLWNQYVNSEEYEQDRINLLGQADADFVFCDARRQEIRVYGPDALRRRIVKKLATHLAEAVVERHELILSRKEFDYIRNNGRWILDKLKRASGATKVDFDFGSKSLLVEGSRDGLERAKSYLIRLQGRNDSKRRASSGGCPVCLCPTSGGPGTVNLSCNHSYCKDCFTAWMTGTNCCQFPLVCLEESCSAEVTMTDLRANLETEALSRLLHKALDDHVRKNPSTLQFCRSAACDGIISIKNGSTLLSCSSCSQSVCAMCNVSHDGLTCKEYALASLPPNRLRLKIVDEILTLRCPRCNQAFLDFDGCFAISCSHCPCNFCGWCMQDCGSSNSEAHDHVKACPEKHPGADSYFGTQEMFLSAQNERRRAKLVGLLQTLSNEDKAQVISSIQHDLTDLGIVL